MAIFVTPPVVAPEVETKPGMPVRAWLSDDVDLGLRYLDRDDPPSVVVALDGDPWSDWTGLPVPPTDLPAATNPPNQWVFTIKARNRSGYNEDGDPTYAWHDIVTAGSLLFEERREYDAVAGMTVITAKATIPYSGDEPVPETSVAVRSDGVRYAVTQSAVGPGRVELWLRRTEQDE